MANHLQLELVTRKTRGGVEERERETESTIKKQAFDQRESQMGCKNTS